MRFAVPMFFLLPACLNTNTYGLRQSEALCDKYFECSDESEDLIESQNWDGVGECYDDDADSYENTMENEEAAACRSKYCTFDADNANDCLTAIRELTCDELKDGDGDLSDCDDDVIDCSDEEKDYNNCMEDAAKNKSE